MKGKSDKDGIASKTSDEFAVVELDEKQLEEVAGGIPTNGNCDCPSCPQPPSGFDNGNCDCCPGEGEFGEI